MQHGHLFRSQETPFAATYILLGQTGKGNAVKVNHLVPYFLKDTAYHTVLTGVDLQSDMLAVLLGELKCVRDDTLVIEDDTGTYDCLIHLVQFTIQGNGINFLFVELRMRQFGRQVTVIGEQQYTGGIAIQATYGIDTLRTSTTNDVDDGMTLLRIIGGGNGVLGFVEQDIHLTFPTNGLVMETDVIGRQHLGTEVIDSDTVDGDHACLDEIIGFPTGTDTCVSEVFIKTYRLGRILHLLFIDLLLMMRVEVVIAFGFTAERFVRTLGTISERTFAKRTLGTIFCKCTFRTLTKGTFGTISSFTGKTGTSRDGLSFPMETRTGSAFSFIVGIKHVFSKH